MARKRAVTMKIRKAVCVYMRNQRPLSTEEREELRMRIAFAISQAAKAQP